MAAVSQEELQERHLPQLATRLQRGPNDVRHTNGEFFSSDGMRKITNSAFFSLRSGGKYSARSNVSL